MIETRDLIAILLDEAVGYGVLLVSPELTITWSNGGACRILACGPDELIGLPYAELFVESDRALGAPQLECDIARARGTSEDDRWHRRLDGSRFWASGLLVALRDSSGRLLGYGKMLRNRTDIKEQVVELQQRVERLEARDRQQVRTLAESAHEMRNSLVSIGALIDATRLGTASAAAIARLADAAKSQFDVMRRLLDDLLDAAGVKTSPRLRPSRVPLQLVLERSLASVRDALQGRRVWLLCPSAPIECFVDVERMQQVIVNLLRNAVKFSSEGSRIYVRLTTEGAEAVIRVEDEGQGIEQSMLARIFDAFTQAEPGGGRDSGIGMGLAIARDLVRLHGGSMQAASDGPGTGATFSIRLPMAG